MDIITIEEKEVGGLVQVTVLHQTVIQEDAIVQEEVDPHLHPGGLSAR